MISNGRIDLTDTQLDLVRELVAKYLPGTVAWAYGSRVKGTARRTSDLDLVVFAVADARAKVSDLKEAFDESDLPFPVDLHVWDEIPEEFQDKITALYVNLRS